MKILISPHRIFLIEINPEESIQNAIKSKYTPALLSHLRGKPHVDCWLLKVPFQILQVMEDKVHHSHPAWKRLPEDNLRLQLSQWIFLTQSFLVGNSVKTLLTLSGRRISNRLLHSEGEYINMSPNLKYGDMTNLHHIKT